MREEKKSHQYITLHLKFYYMLFFSFLLFSFISHFLKNVHVKKSTDLNSLILNIAISCFVIMRNWNFE